MDPATKKLEELRATYTPFLEGMIGRLEDKEQRSGQKNVQLERLRSLHKFLTTSQKQPKLDTLEKMENIIKSMHDKVGTAEHTPSRPSSTHQRPSSRERQDHSSSSHHDWRRQSYTHYDSNRKDDRRDTSRRSEGSRHETSRNDSGRGGDDHREERPRHSSSRTEGSRHGHRSDSSSRDGSRSEGSRIESSRIEGSRSESSRSDSSRSELPRSESSRPEVSRQEHGRHETSRHDSYRHREEHHRRDYGRKEDSKHGRGDRFEDPRHGGRQDERRYDALRHDPVRHEPSRHEPLRHDPHRQEMGKGGGSLRPSYSHEERREGSKKQVGSIPPEKASPILTKKSLLSLPMPPVASGILDSIPHPSSSESHQSATESSKFLSSREKLQRLFGMNKSGREEKSQSKGSHWGSYEPPKGSESRHEEMQWQESKGRRDVPVPETGWHHGRETDAFKERSFRNPSPPHLKHSQQQSPSGSTKPGHFIPDTPMSPDHANFGAMDTPQSPELGASFSPTPSTDDLLMVRNIPLENVKGTIDLDIVKNALSFIKEQESKAHGKSPSQPEKDSHGGSVTSTVSTKNSEDEPYDPEEVWKSSFEETPAPHIPVSTHGDVDLRLTPALTAPHQPKVHSSTSTPVSVVRPQEKRMTTSFGSNNTAQPKGNVTDSSVHERPSTSAPPPTPKHSGASPLNIPVPSTFTPPPQVPQPVSTDIRQHPPQSPTLGTVGNRPHDSKRLHQGTPLSPSAAQGGDVDMRVSYHPPFHRPSPSTGNIGRSTLERRPSLEDWREREKGGEQPNRIEGIRSRLAQESNEFIKPGQKGVAFTQLERYKQQRQGRHPGGLPDPKRDMGASPTARGDGSDSNRKDTRSVLDKLLPEHKDTQDSPSESKASQPYGNRDPRLKVQDSKGPVVPSEPPPISRDPRMSAHQTPSSMGHISNHPSSGITVSAHLPSGGQHPMHHPPAGSSMSSHSPLNHAPLERPMPPSHPSPRDMHTGHHMSGHPPRDPRQMVSRDPRQQQNHPQPSRPMESHMEMKMYGRDPRMGPRQMEMQDRSRMQHMPPPVNMVPTGQGRMPYSSWDAPRAPERLAPPPSASGSLIGETFTCLMMRGLPRFANSNHIYQYFHDYLLRDMCIELDFTYNCKGTAYVQFPSHLTAKDAFERYSNGTVQGYPVELRICSVGILRQAKTTYGQQNKEREAHLGIPERPRGNCNPYYKPRPKEPPKPRPVMRHELSEGSVGHGVADKKGGEVGRGGYSALCAVKTGGLQSFKIPKIRKADTASAGHELPKKLEASGPPGNTGKKVNEHKGKADKSDSDDELVDIPVTTKKDRKFKKICVVSDSESDSEGEEKQDESREKTGKDDDSVVTDDREDHDDDSDDSLVIDEEVGQSDSDEEVIDKKPPKAPVAPAAAKGKTAGPKKPKKMPPKKTPAKPAPVKTPKPPKKAKTPKPKAPKQTGTKRGRPKKVVAKKVVESPGKLDIGTLSQGMKVTRQTLGVLSTEVVKTKLKVTIPVPLKEMVTLVKEEVVKKRGRKRKIEIVEEEEKKESSDSLAMTEDSSFDPEVSEQQPNFEGMITEDMVNFSEESKLMKPKKRKAAAPKKGGKGLKKQKLGQQEEEEEDGLKDNSAEDDQDALVSSMEGKKNIGDEEEKETSKEFIHKLFIEDEDDLALPDLNNLNPSLLDEDPTICNALPDVSALADVLNPTITDEKFYSSNEEKQSKGSQPVTQDDQASSGTSSEEIVKNKTTAAMKGETEESVNKKDVEETESEHTLGEQTKTSENEDSKTEKNKDSIDGSVASEELLKPDTKKVLGDSKSDLQIPPSDECVDQQAKDKEMVKSKKKNKGGVGMESASGNVDSEFDTHNLPECDGKAVESSNTSLGELVKSGSESSSSDTGKRDLIKTADGRKDKPACGEEVEIVTQTKENKAEKHATEKSKLSNEVDKVKCDNEEKIGLGGSEILSDSKPELSSEFDGVKCEIKENKMLETSEVSQKTMKTKVLDDQKLDETVDRVKSEINKDEIKATNEAKKVGMETDGQSMKWEGGNEQESEGCKKMKLGKIDMKGGDIKPKEEKGMKKENVVSLGSIEKDVERAGVKSSGDSKEKLIDEDSGDNDKGAKPTSSSKATGEASGKEGSSEPVLLKTGKGGKSGEDDDVGSIELGSVGSFPEDASVVSVDSHDTKASETGRKKRGKTVTPQPPLERRRVTRSVRSLVEPLELEVALWDDGGVTDLYQCDQCDYVGRNIVQHLVNIHSEREVPCEFKKEDFYPVLKDKPGPPEGFFDHKGDELDFSWIPQSMTFEETVWCNECDYNSNSRFDLIYHVLVHSPNIAHLAFHCWLCLYMTENMEDFYNHVSSHTGEYRYTCVNCGYKAYKKSALQAHHEECHRTQPEKFEVEDMILEDGWPYIYTCKTCLLVSISHDKAKQHVAIRHMGKGDIFKSNMTRPIVIHHDRKMPEGLASRLKPKSKRGKRGKKSQPANMNVFVGNEEEEEGKGQQAEKAQELLDRIYTNMHPSTSAKERQDRINILDNLSKKLHSSPSRKSPSNMSPERSLDGSIKPKEGGELEIDTTLKESEVGEQDESNKINCTPDSGGKRNESIEKKLKKDFSKVPHEKDKDKEISEHKNDDLKISGENGGIEVKKSEDSVSFDQNSESEDSLSQTSDTESTLTDIEGVTDLEGLSVKSPLLSTILKLKNNLASSLKKPGEKVKVKESVNSSPKAENGASTSEGQQISSAKNLNKSGNDNTDEVQVIERIGSEMTDQEKKGKVVAPVPGLVPLSYTVLDTSQQVQISGQDPSSSLLPRLRIRPPEQLMKQPVPASSSDPEFCCAVPGCGYRNDKKKLIDHIIVEHGPFKCISSGCLFITKNISEYITHMKTLHSYLRILVCPFHCDVRFRSQAALIFHLTDVHKPPSVTPAPEKEDLINVEVKDSEGEGFLKIESVSTLDPSMASQMWGEEYDESRVNTNVASSPAQGGKAHSESPDPKKLLPMPGGVKVVPSAQPQPSISTPSTVAKTTPQKQPPDIVNLDDEEEQDEIEKDPPGMASLPLTPPTVPVLKRFILYQSLEVFRTLTTRLAPETFKCMIHGCVYATDVDVNFEDHAKAHGRDHRCCYCLLLLPTAKELVQHIVTEHSHCSFQCKYCLYRTLTKAYMGVHVRNFHPKEEPRFVIVTNPRREPPPSPPVEQVVHPYRCNYEGCQYRTVDAEVFKSHVATHGNNIILQCHFCQSHFHIQSLIQHMTKHNVNEYQCAYCVYGEAEKEKIFTHLLNCHPGRPGKVLLRRQFVGGNVGMGAAGKGQLPAAPTSTTSEASKQSTKQPQPSAIHGRSTSVNGEDAQLPKVDKETSSPSVQPSRVTRSTSLDTSQTRLLSKGSILNKSASSDADKLGTGEDGGATEKLGLTGHDLYRCGNEMCGYSCSSQAQLKEHLQVCDLSQDSPQLQCFHCSRQFRHLSALLDHLRVHGPKRYRCGAIGCDYKATMLHYFKNHMKQVHRMSGYRQVAKDPANKDPETQQFIVYPKDALPIGKEPLRKRKNEYGVEDIDKIPKIHILYHDIKCYHCHFSTKVRLNMIKHLWLHKKYSSGIPSKICSASGQVTPIPVKHPVNPVPCLERNELMFDKMMNLAGSSFEKKKKEEVDLRVKNPIPKDELEKLPPYVPEERLNCCGIEGCNYLSCDDIMLKYHIKTLHANVTNFPCPHCKDCQITIEKMNSHFKLHGERLYRCGWCPYLSYKQSLVERHMKDKHWTKKSFDFVIREPEDPEISKKPTDSPIPTDTQNVDLPPTEDPQWQCGLCQFSCVTQQEMVNHVSFKHEIKSQFKCGYCNVRSSVRTSFDVHFAAKHPHEAFRVLCMYYRKDSADIEPLSQDCGKNCHEPLWKRNDPLRIRRIRGILLEDPDEDKRKPWLQNDDPGLPQDDFFVCPICSRFKTNELSTFRAHLCKESDYHRYECSECGISNALLASIQRHYTKVHHSSFTKDCYVELPIEDEKEAWVESIVSHQQALIKEWQAREGAKPKSAPVSGSQMVQPATPGMLAATAGKAPLRRRASTEARQQLLLQQELEDQDLQHQQIPVKRLSEGSQVSSTGGAATTPRLGGVVLHDSGSDRGKFSCKLCGAECKSAAGLKSHNTAMHQARFKCMYCPYSSNTEIGVTQHCTSKHPKLQNQVVDVTERDKGQKGEEQVGVAGKSDVESESEHMQETEESLDELPAASPNSKTYKCPHCAFTSTSPQTVAAHKRRQHMDHRPYLCVYCGNRFEHEHDGIRHHKMVHKDKEIQLDFAPQGSTRESPVSSSLPVSSSAEINVAKEPKIRKVSAWRRISADDSKLLVPRKDISQADAKKQLDKSGELERDSGSELNSDYNEDKEYICMHCPARGHRQYIEEHIKIQHRTLSFQITVVGKGGSLTSEVYSYKCQHCPTESKSLSEAMDHWCKCHVSQDFKFQLKLINSTVFGGAEEASGQMKPPKTPRVFDGRSPNPGSVSDVDEELLEPSGDESEGGSSTIETYGSSGEGTAKTEDFVYACGYCKKSSSQIKDIYDHQLKIHPDKDCKVRKYPREIYLKTFGVFYQCGYCDERLARVPMKQHITHAHPGCEIKMTKVDSSSSNNICFRCEVCGHVVKRCKSIRHHLQRHHPGYPDTTWTRLTLGSSSRPPVKQPFRCNYCEELGDSLEQMQRHHIFLHSHLQESITNLMDEALSSVHGPSSAPSSSSNLLSPGASCSPVMSPPYSSGAISSQSGHTSVHAGGLRSPEAGPSGSSTSLASPVHSVPSSPSYWSAAAASIQDEVSTSQRPRLKNTARKSFVTSASRQRMVAFKSTASKRRTSSECSDKEDTDKMEDEEASDEGSIAEEFSFYGVKQPKLDLNSIYTTITMGMGIPMRLRTAQVYHPLNLDCKIEIVDLKDSVQQSLTF